MATNYSEGLVIRGPDGYAANVTDNGLIVSPQSRFDAANAEGRAFSWASLTYDPDAHDTILAIENNSSEVDVYIRELLFTSDTASMIQVFFSSGVTMAGTAVTGVCLNRNFNTVAPTTAKADETGNGEQAGGYTGGHILQKYVAANTPVHIVFPAPLVLDYDHVIGVDLTTAATAANATFVGWIE